MPHDIAQLLSTALELYSFVLLARIVMSWIPNLDRGNPIVQFLYQITDPVLEPVRQMIPPLGMIDISPIVVFIAIRILQGLILGASTGL